jgi:ADP-heptose:LPS heptosyltransferase
LHQQELHCLGDANAIYIWNRCQYVGAVHMKKWKFVLRAVHMKKWKFVLRRLMDACKVLSLSFQAHLQAMHAHPPSRKWAAIRFGANVLLSED